MKKLKIILPFFLLLACTKGGGNIYVEGKVYNPITDEGIGGVQIELWKPGISSGAYGPNESEKAVKTVYTDADGKYSIKHTGVFSSYYVKVSNCGDRYALGWTNISTKDKEYPDVLPLNSVKVKKSKNMHADFQAVPYGYLKLSIHNVNCMGGDSMRFRFQTIGESDFESWSNYRTGCYMYDDPGGGVKVPMGWRYY